MELSLPWFTIYSWSLLMAYPSLISNFRFCLKPTNQILFNKIGFPTMGGYAMCWHKYKEKEKSSFPISFTNNEAMDIERWKFSNSECTLFLKRKTSLHKVIWSLAFQSVGTSYIFAPIQMKRNCFFFFFLIINLLTVIQWVNKACGCFKRGKQPYTSFCLIASAF